MITIIVALTKDYAIGDKGDLLFHISDDLKRFKALTMGHPIIMGRKTFESFPKGALPGRRNIVVTRNESYTAPGIETAKSLEDAISMCGTASQIFVIGGGEIYREAILFCDRLELTMIDAVNPEADTRFPHLDADVWDIPDQKFDKVDPRSGVRYSFLTIKRNSRVISEK